MDHGNTFMERWRKKYWCGTAEYTRMLVLQRHVTILDILIVERGGKFVHC
jgi:hypothetical protein